LTEFRVKRHSSSGIAAIILVEINKQDPDTIGRYRQSDSNPERIAVAPLPNGQSQAEHDDNDAAPEGAEKFGIAIIEHEFTSRCRLEPDLGNVNSRHAVRTNGPVSTRANNGHAAWSECQVVGSRATQKMQQNAPGDT